MVRRPAGRCRIDLIEPEVAEFQRIDEHIDRANRIALADPIIEAFRQQRRLLAIRPLNETAARPHQALTSPGKATTKWTKLPAMVGRNVKKTDRSKAKSASTMVTIQPSKLAHGEFLLAPGVK
jgi:hypothetical protein